MHYFLFLKAFSNYKVVNLRKESGDLNNYILTAVQQLDQDYQQHP